MIVSKITEAVIYESPDGGETVYVRESGQDPSMRQLHSESQKASAIRDSMRENQLWHQIRLAARDNPALQDALERAIIIYELSKSQPPSIMHHPV
jgi:hypothetical protein